MHDEPRCAAPVEPPVHAKSKKLLITSADCWAVGANKSTAKFSSNGKGVKEVERMMKEHEKQMESDSDEDKLYNTLLALVKKLDEKRRKKREDGSDDDDTFDDGTAVSSV